MSLIIFNTNHIVKFYNIFYVIIGCYNWYLVHFITILHHIYVLISLLWCGSSARVISENAMFYNGVHNPVCLQSVVILYDIDQLFGIWNSDQFLLLPVQEPWLCFECHFRHMYLCRGYDYLTQGYGEVCGVAFYFILITLKESIITKID